MDTPQRPHPDLSADLNSQPRPSILAYTVIGVVLAAFLVPLSVANVALRARFHEVEDGVLWVSRTDGVVAAEVAPATPAARAGIQAGDVLLAVDGQPIDRPAEVVDLLHGSRVGQPLRYTLLRLESHAVVDLQLAPVPHGNTTLYYVLAAVGIFTLIVALLVRLRRPGDPATLHFLWLALAFFGTFAFSFNGTLDRLDWVFYWVDAVALLLLAPLFLHFTLVFPERPRAWEGSRVGPFVIPLIYLPALLLGAARVIAVTRAALDARFYVSGIVGTLERVEPAYLSLCVIGGLVRARPGVRAGPVGDGAPPAPLDRLGHGAGRNAVRARLRACRSRSASRRRSPMQLTAIPLGLVPLAFAGAVVRYRLMDVEVIVKRMLVYAAVVSAILAIYAVLLRVAGAVFLADSHQNNTVIAMLATLVVVLLARPVTSAIQTTVDRAFYRDRYDYRRALVGFARDLNADLDLFRLSERLVARVTETLLVDRMAVMLVNERAGEFTSVRTAGLGRGTLSLPRASDVRRAPGERPGGRPRRSERHARLRVPTRWSSGGIGGSSTSCPACRRRGRSRCWRSGGSGTASR